MRVSTKEQEDEGFGLETQKNKLHAYIEHHPTQSFTTKPEWLFTDIQSGSEYMRPGLQKLIKLIKTGAVDTVLIYKIDRLSRSLKHLLELFEVFKEYNIALISIQENLDFRGAIGNLILHVFGAIAEFERELIKTRTRSGIIASAEMGNFTGTAIPYGYESVKNPRGKGKRLRLCQTKSKVAKKIFQWYIYENMGDLAIAKRLNRDNNWRTEKAKWTAGAVSNLLKNPLYHGEFIANKRDENGQLLSPDQWTIVQVPAIIDDLTYHLAQSRRKARSVGRKPNKYVYLLSGKIIDISQPEGKRFVGKPRTKGGRSYLRRSYTNAEGKYIPSFVIPAIPIEKEVWARLKSALDKPEAFIREYLAKADTVECGKDATQQRINGIREDRINIEFQIARIEKAYEENTYTLEKMNAKIAPLNEALERIAQQQKELSEQLLSLHQHQETISGIRETAEKFKFALDQFTEKQKQMLVDLLVERVEVNRIPKAISAKGRTLWEKTVSVFMRFDPTLFASKGPDGRTLRSGCNEHLCDSLAKNRKLGGERDHRYNLIGINYTLEYQVVRGNANVSKRIGVLVPFPKK